MLFAATGGVILTPDCDTAMCLDRGGYRLVAIGFALAGLLAMVVGLRSVGPASADPGQATWLLSPPRTGGCCSGGGCCSSPSSPSSPVGHGGCSSASPWSAAPGPGPRSCRCSARP